MKLNLKRPLVFFDLETTGVQVGTDRIVEICLHKVMPDGTTQTLVRRVRPVDANGKTMHIPEQTTAIHGISDADVANEPSFAQLVPELSAFIGDADLAGFNSNRFDVPLLVEEFMRAGSDLDLTNRHLVDVQNIFHKMEQRTLKAAYRFYCNKELENAHTAAADTIATAEVLMAQLDRYQDADYTAPDGTVVPHPVQNNVEALSRFSTAQPWADLVGHIAYDAKHRMVINFGKHKGKTLDAIFSSEPAYYDWMMKADFPLSTKKVLRQAWQQYRQQLKLEALKDHFGGDSKR